MKKYYAESELIINPDGSIFHLHIKPEQLANKIILVGDPGRVALVASHFDTKEDRKSTRLNSSHNNQSRMPSSA